MSNSKENTLATDITLANGLKTAFKTLSLTGFGTVALVGAHHLGRKQYNTNARLLDYVEGVLDVLGKSGYKTRYRKTNSNKNTSKKTTRYKSNQTQQSHSQPFQPPDVEDGLFKESSNENEVNSTEIKPSHWVSGVADLDTNEFAVVGIDNERQIVWQTRMPERVHDILIQPLSATKRKGQDRLYTTNDKATYNLRNIDKQHVAVMGRRPSEWFWVLNSYNGDVIHSIKSDINRHFYGHACYSLEGDLLYVTENNTVDFGGIVGVYEVASGYKKIDEFATYGIGPHEIVMHPDGETLVIANGGIKTERASREELNIDSMQPSLVYLNRHNGKLLEQVYPEHNQMSVRHLAMHDNGTVGIGIQFQGQRHLSVPMLLTHMRGDKGLTPLKLPETDDKGWHRFHHYIASVAVDSKRNLLCATSPIGNCAAVFDLHTGVMIGSTELPDCAGVANYQFTDYQETNYQDLQLGQNNPSFIVTDGQGYLTLLTIDVIANSPKVNIEKVYQPYAFDNHLKTIAS